MENNILVTVVCLTYNHEKYIGRALESFINQKTNFRFEVIVHDDASTDSTAKVIRDYALKYPEIIKPIIQTENQYSKGVNINVNFILPNIQGKYVALCEGDDFWIDNYKLQKQIDALEVNPKCLMCSHYTEAQDIERGNKWRLPLGDFCTGVIPTERIFDAVFGLMHVSSDVFRTEVYKDYRMADLKYKKIMPTGDRAILLYFANRGPIYFIAETMSRYNKGVEGSYTRRIEQNRERNIKKNKLIVESELLFREECCKESLREVLDRYIAADWFELKKSMDSYSLESNDIDYKMFELLTWKKKFLCRLGILFPKLPRILWSIAHKNL